MALAKPKAALMARTVFQEPRFIGAYGATARQERKQKSAIEIRVHYE
jgi:hypothetical protein